MSSIVTMSAPTFVFDELAASIFSCETIDDFQSEFGLRPEVVANTWQMMNEETNLTNVSEIDLLLMLRNLKSPSAVNESPGIILASQIYLFHDILLTWFDTVSSQT